MENEGYASRMNWNQEKRIWEIKEMSTVWSAKSKPVNWDMDRKLAHTICPQQAQEISRDQQPFHSW